MTTKIILIKETTVKSVLTDIFTYFMVVTVIGTGVYLESNAMQWVGFTMLVLGLLGHSHNKGVSVEEAKKQLEEMD
ncbi:MAG: hypothetical protein JKY50_00290 [Oleispira sp.]|nr:hypothetical protein [Oleispira sp.]